MRVINYFDNDRKEHWLNEIKRGDWGAAGFLYELLSKGTFFDAAGKNSKVLLLTDGDELISFCTYAEKDDIQPTELTPWMGFAFTFPEQSCLMMKGTFILFELKGMMISEGRP